MGIEISPIELSWKELNSFNSSRSFVVQANNFSDPCSKVTASWSFSLSKNLSELMLVAVTSMEYLERVAFLTQ